MDKTKTSLITKIKEVLTYGMIIAVGLGIGLGAKEAWAWYNKVPAYIEINTSAHFANVDEKVIIYSTQWCPYCKRAKEYLVSNNISFFERDIESGDKIINQLYGSIGSEGIPKIVIGDKIINGFNTAVLRQELEKQKLL